LKLAAVLAALLGLTGILLAGCLGSVPESRNEKKPDDGRVTITWLGKNLLPATSMGPGTPAQKLLEGRFGVKIEPLLIESPGWKDRITAMFASGQIPDIIWVNNIQELAAYANQGILAEVPQEMLRQFAPNYYSDVMSVDPKVMYLSQYKGVNYAMVRIDPIATSKRMSGVRQSWYDRVGMTAEPETIEDYESMFIRFRDNDPDGNGKKDTYAFSLAWREGSGNFGGAANDLTSQFFYAYGTMPSMRFIKKGKVVDGSVQPELKDGLRLLGRWYDMGLIDPEFLVDDSGDLQSKFIDGRIGFYGRTIWWLNPNGITTNALKAKMPSDGVKLLKPPAGPGGLRGIVQDNPAGSGMIAFGKQLQQDSRKLQTILSMLDAAGSDPGLTYQLGRVGVEGIHWNYDTAGALRPILPYDKPENLAKEGKTEFFAPYLSRAYQFAVLPKGVNKLLAEFGVGPFDPIYKYPLPSSIQLQSKVWDTVDEWIAYFIIGKKDIDRDWDAYVAAWRAAGGDVLEKEADEVYQSMFSK
jgi:putative aldouronate transport system substrate-binding protein